MRAIYKKARAFFKQPVSRQPNFYTCYEIFSVKHFLILRIKPNHPNQTEPPFASRLISNSVFISYKQKLFTSVTGYGMIVPSVARFFVCKKCEGNVEERTNRGIV